MFRCCLGRTPSRSEPAMTETKGSLPLSCQMSSKFSRDLLSTSNDSSYLEIVRIKGHYLTFQEPYLKKFNLYTLCINFASSKISLSQKEQKSQPLSGIKSLSFCFHHRSVTNSPVVFINRSIIPCVKLPN